MKTKWVVVAVVGNKTVAKFANKRKLAKKLYKETKAENPLNTQVYLTKVRKAWPKRLLKAA